MRLWRSGKQKRRVRRMKRTPALGLVAVFLVWGGGREIGAAVQQPQQTPQVTATNPGLERRDRPVTNDDLRILSTTTKRPARGGLFCALQKACIDAWEPTRYRHM